jgi:hypothetical protein
MIDHMLQFYDTNFISTYYSIRNRFEYSLIQSMIERIDKIDWKRLIMMQSLSDEFSSNWFEDWWFFAFERADNDHLHSLINTYLSSYEITFETIFLWII